MRYFSDIIEHACQTPGAVYHTAIKADTVGVQVTLPKQVHVGSLSDDEGQHFDDLIHDAMEKIVAELIDKSNPDAPALWRKARAAEQKK